MSVNASTSQKSVKGDEGISLPLVLMALFALSFMGVMMLSVSHLNLRSGQYNLQRSETTAAVDAGINDFLYRYNSDVKFQGWDVAKALPYRRNQARGITASSRDFPDIVRESALGAWVSLDSSSTEAFTYNIVKRDGNRIIVRVTGRSGYDVARYKTFDFELATAGQVISSALHYENPFIDPDQYELLVSSATYNGANRWRDNPAVNINDDWGQSSNANGVGKLHVSEYKNLCIREYNKYENYRNFSSLDPRCIRAHMSAGDEFVGDITVPYPLSVHGPQSCLRGCGGVGTAATASRAAGMPDIQGKIHILADVSSGADPDSLKSSINRKFAVSTKRGGICIQTYTNCIFENVVPARNIFYSSRQLGLRSSSWDVVARTRDSESSNPKHRSNIPVKADDLISKADCVFEGNTQIIIEDDKIHVLSPLTGGTLNNGKANWCRTKASGLYGKTRNASEEDIKGTESYQKLNRTDLEFNFNVQRDKAQTFTLPKGAIIAVRNSRRRTCAPTGYSNRYYNTTRIGYPTRMDQGDLPIGSDVIGAWHGNDTHAWAYDCRDGDLFIDGRVDGQYTFVAEDDIYLTGGIRYASRYAPTNIYGRLNHDSKSNGLPSDSEDMVGLVAKDDIMVYGTGYFELAGAVSRTFMRRTPRMYIGLFHNIELFGTQMYRDAGNDFGKGYLFVPKKLVTPSGKSAPVNIAWLPLPVYDGVYIAENGFFGLQMPFSQYSYDFEYNSALKEGRMDLIVFGAVYQKHKGFNHREVKGFGLDSYLDSSWHFYGLDEKFYYDDRLKFMSPPGFGGGKMDIRQSAEVYEKHLPGCYEIVGSRFTKTSSDPSC